MIRLFLDIEVYQNYFLALFMTEQGKTKGFEIFDGDDSAFAPQEILDILQNPDFEIVTFNGNHYDIPILTMAMTNQNTRALKKASNRIIEGNVRSWNFYRNEGLREPKINHVDIIDVAPGMVSLKIYGGRLASRKLQELPIEHTAMVNAEQAKELRTYCKNDVRVTQLLFNSLSKQVDLRRVMGKKYGIDLRSKSDAQIAEAVLKAEYKRITGEMPPKVTAVRDSFYYDPPAYVKFSTPLLQDVLETARTAEMIIDDKTGHVKMPKAIATMVITVGQSRYKIGIGGLHSQESEVAHFADDETLLLEEDVESYYPRMMLNMNMQPGGFGEHFNRIYGGILEERLAAKHAADMVKSDSLKIVLNGTFGKTCSPYSPLYAPEFMIRTTLTGQLTMLMLIEALERYGIPVVSANTDGIVVKCRHEDREALNLIVHKWEKHTGLKTEEASYKALYSRDVNNYIAVKTDGKVKAKGVFGPVSLSKNPQTPICPEAVIAYLTEGTPVDHTIRACRDISKFLTLRTVTGGAIKDNEALGKAIRWYYAEGETGEIHYAKNGNTVPRSDGAKPLMDLPDEFPIDVDYEWYIKECEEILMAVGAEERPFVEKLPRKNSNAWKELRDTGKIIEGKKGKWQWLNQ
jgi:DNA polymerase elongation subunit (family B)